MDDPIDDDFYQGSTIDTASILRLFRTFLKAAHCTDPDSTNRSSWEEAGQDLWDASAVEYIAVVLYDNGAVEMLASLCQAAAAHNNWRAAELAVGILGNIACYSGRKLLHDASLAQLITELMLPADNAAVAGEACRLCATVLPISQVDNPWFKHLTTETSLACLLWIIENVTITQVLYRAFSLLAALLNAPTQSDLGPLACRVINLNFLPLALSAVFARLEDLDGSEEDFFTPQKDAMNEGNLLEHTISAPVNRDIVYQALLGVFILIDSEEGKAALVASKDVWCQNLVRLLAKEGSASRLASSCLCLLPLFKNETGELLARNEDAVHVLLGVLRLKSSAGPKLEDKYCEDPVWECVAVLMGYLSEVESTRFNELRAIAENVISGVKDFSFVSKGTAEQYCRRSIAALQLRLR